MDSEEWIKRRTSWWKWSEERWTSIWKVEHWRMRTSQSATTAVSWCQIRAACHERAAHGHDKRMLNHQEEVGSWRSRKKRSQNETRQMPRLSDDIESGFWIEIKRRDSSSDDEMNYTELFFSDSVGFGWLLFTVLVSNPLWLTNAL